MPRALVGTNELNEATVTLNKKMRRYLRPSNSLKVGVGIPVEPVGNKSTTNGVPNSPGGKLIEWITTKSMAMPAGRGPQLGDGMAVACDHQPSCHVAS